jgi:hypothetical protein
VIRVDGMVRGVVIPAAGQYEVTMSYRPAAFSNGTWIAGATAVLLLALLAWDRAPWRGARPWTSPRGGWQR